MIRLILAVTLFSVSLQTYVAGEVETLGIKQPLVELRKSESGEEEGFCQYSSGASCYSFFTQFLQRV